MDDKVACGGELRCVERCVLDCMQKRECWRALSGYYKVEARVGKVWDPVMRGEGEGVVWSAK